MAPLACLAKKPVGTKTIDKDVFFVIFSFLLPKDTSLEKIGNMYFALFDAINDRPSLNKVWGVGCSFPLYAFNKMFYVPQGPKDALLIKDVEILPDESEGLQQEGVAEGGGVHAEFSNPQA